MWFTTLALCEHNKLTTKILRLQNMKNAMHQGPASSNNENNRQQTGIHKPITSPVKLSRVSEHFSAM